LNFQKSTTRTASKFQYGIPGGADFEATHLEAVGECPGDLAVVGVDPAAIRVISPSEDHSPVPKELELKARRLLDSLDAFVEEQWPISDSTSRVVGTGQFALLLFECERRAAVVLLENNNLFKLEGRCTKGHVFFAVGDRLHLTYWDSCCGCGSLNKLVYEL
jgi:hypothetical protein